MFRLMIECTFLSLIRFVILIRVVVTPKRWKYGCVSPALRDLLRILEIFIKIFPTRPQTSLKSTCALIHYLLLLARTICLAFRIADGRREILLKEDLRFIFTYLLLTIFVCCGCKDLSWCVLVYARTLIKTGLLLVSRLVLRGYYQWFEEAILVLVMQGGLRNTVSFKLRTLKVHGCLSETLIILPQLSI